MRFIDADKFPTREFVIDVLYDCGVRADIKVEEVADEIFEMFSKDIPTADVIENVHGEWLVDKYQAEYCSECGFKAKQPDLFCGGCGSRME